MSAVPAIITRYYELIEAGNPDHLAMLYAADGEIVRYDGVTKPGTIADYFREYLADRAGLRLQSIDQVRDADDVLMWDALLDSELGLLQTVDVVILDDNGLIWRHIPGFRGYWGQ